MTRYTCLNKIRNYSGTIKQYIILDNMTGESLSVDPNTIRKGLKSGKLDINNLKLSIDGRIIDNNVPCNISGAINRMAFNHTTEDILNRVYNPKNQEEQSENNYILKKSRSNRCGNAILLALKIGATYSVA